MVAQPVHPYRTSHLLSGALYHEIVTIKPVGQSDALDLTPLYENDQRDSRTYKQSAGRVQRGGLDGNDTVRCLGPARLRRPRPSRSEWQP